MAKTDGHVADELLFDTMDITTLSSRGLKGEGRQFMQLKEAYLERAGVELEDLAARVALLKTRIAKQNVSVPLEHRWQLAWVRNRFENFKRRVEQLEEASEGNLEEARIASELAWKDLQRAVDALLSALRSRGPNKTVPRFAGCLPAAGKEGGRHEEDREDARGTAKETAKDEPTDR